MTKIEDKEKFAPQPSGKTSQKIFQLREVIDMGEYDPEYLSTFTEWHTLSKTIQWSMIKKALDIRERQLVQQWSEINNVMDFRLKPELKIALKNIQDKIHQVNNDREKLIMEYFS